MNKIPSSRPTPLRLLLAALVFFASMSWTSCTHQDGYQHLSWMSHQAEPESSSDRCCDHQHSVHEDLPSQCEQSNCVDKLISGDEYTVNSSSPQLQPPLFTLSSSPFVFLVDESGLKEHACFLCCIDSPPHFHLSLISGVQQLI